MLDKYTLETLYASKGPYAFLAFLMVLYEIPKRRVDAGLSKSEKNGVGKLFTKFFAENGLPHVNIQRVRDAYVHRIAFTGDLYFGLMKLEVSDIMPYIRYFTWIYRRRT